MSEPLKVGAPDEIGPLFTVRTVGIPHHPRVSSSPLRAILQARALGVAVAQLKEAIWGYWKFLRGWACHCVLSVHHSVILSRPLQVRSLEGFFFGHATRDGELGRLATNVMGAYLGRSSGDAN